MIETAYEAFLKSTTGRYTVTGTSFVWCASPTLCGALLWGEQTEAETRAILRIFDQYPQQMARKFDIVLDTRGVESVNPTALAVLLSWLVERRTELTNHLRLQANIIGEGTTAILLTGLLPIAKWPVPYGLHHDPREAFRAVLGDEGPPLSETIESIAERTRGVSRELRIAREQLARRLDTSVDDVARALGISSRSLQRSLTRHGTSFHAEVVRARLSRAQELLRSSDDKVATIAARVGISERALTTLFREETGLGPAEWRKRQSRQP